MCQNGGSKVIQVRKDTALNVRQLLWRGGDDADAHFAAPMARRMPAASATTDTARTPCAV